MFDIYTPISQGNRAKERQKHMISLEEHIRVHIRIQADTFPCLTTVTPKTNKALRNEGATSVEFVESSEPVSSLLLPRASTKLLNTATTTRRAAMT